MYTIVFWTLDGFACASWVGSLTGEMNVSWLVKMRVRSETEDA